ncbi:hypothetical protein SAMN05444349_14123 [Bacteroides faecichinchillae]|uniref:Uncharacterized protein n=1 Tax=Bacteroides faecichinchillae TaxID=871325 RepID=A0A1M5F4Z9_9BACE|nr:hypothetical protein SAMN05444349_14123 [Bacteroides faecichinchillae]
MKIKVKYINNYVILLDYIKYYVPLQHQQQQQCKDAKFV